MKQNYAIIDGKGIISDGFDSDIEAYEEFDKLFKESYEFKHPVLLVQIIDYLT